MEHIIRKYGKLIMEVSGAFAIGSLVAAIFFGGRLAIFINAFMLSSM